jgi:rhamnosyltransferase
MVPNVNSVCAAIITYNIGAGIRRCFNSISEQVQEVLIIDNGSDSATTDELRALEGRHRATVIYNDRNLGIGAALNQGAHYAIKKGYRWLLSLDHDSEATPGMVEKLLESYATLGAGTGIVAARPFDRNAKLFCGPPEAAGLDRGAIEARMVLSSGSLIDVRTFDTVGFFNESLFLYCIDTDFCLRTRKAGLKIYVRCDALLLHAEGRKHWKRFLWRRVVHDGYSPEARYYIARNIVFMLRNYAREHPRFCLEIVAHRLLQDSVKFMLYDGDRLRHVCSVLQGLYDGAMGRYGARGSSNRLLKNV